MTQSYIVAIAVTSTLLCSCASYRFPEPLTCAAMGAGVGAVAGSIGGQAYSENHSSGGAVGIGVATTIASAAIGYAVCAEALHRKARAGLPPPPPPEPASASAAARHRRPSLRRAAA